MAASTGEINLSEPVSAHMRVEVARLREGQTVGEALAELRRSPPPARIVYFYVVDDDGRLKGVIPARALLLSPPDARLADLCELFVLQRFLAFPVVDAQRRLVGAIDVELYTDELHELGGGDSDDDLFQLIGVHLARARQKNPLGAFRLRFPWLLCNIAGGIAAAFLSGLFEAELQRAVALALFIPVVLALAESVSIQSVSLAIQLLHGTPPRWRAILEKMRAEFTVGALLGGAAGLLVGLTALAWIGQLHIAGSVFGGIAGGVAAAALLGAAVPNLLHRFRLNPQVAAGPIVLAATDLATLLCYFHIAKGLLPP